MAGDPPPTPRHAERGENWTTLLVAARVFRPARSGRSSPRSSTSDRRSSASSVSTSSNHFFGRDLFAAPAPQPQGVLALRFHGLAAFEGPFLYQARLDDPPFAQKWRWEVYEKEADAANGDYHHGVPETLSPRIARRIESLKTMARAWGAVLDDNRVMPRR